MLRKGHSYLKQTCIKKLQVCLSMCALLLLLDIKGLFMERKLNKRDTKHFSNRDYSLSEPDPLILP